MNKGTFIGRVGQDAELHYTPQGAAVCSFSMAIDNGKNKDTGEKRPPLWIKASLWNKRAESLAQYITKGKLVAVIGRVGAEAWSDKQSGEAKAKIVVTVDEFEFCGGSNGGNEQEPQQPPQTNNNLGSDGITDEDIPF